MAVATATPAGQEGQANFRQTPPTPTGPPRASWPKVDPSKSVNWPLNTFDLANAKYVPLDQITATNVDTLAVRWLYHTRGSNSTPIVVDGVMYISTQRGTEALDAATGNLIWDSTVATTARGVTYGDGRIYVATRNGTILALDARTGALVEGFGDQGVSNVLMDVLKTRHPAVAKAIDIGYSYTSAPQYFKNILVIGTANSDQMIPGGWVFGIDGTTGRLLWKFNTVPQGPDDEGWEIAKDTWVGGARHGAGIWQTPAIDSESGTVYLVAGNPYPSHDGTARKGKNLFSLCFLALDVRTGRLKWYYQQVHHDLWDLDSGQQPTLFDIQVKGRTIKALAAGNKNGYVYVLNRETGEPISPIVETPVDTKSEMPGEEPWPTQPIPQTAAGRPMEPVAGSVVRAVNPEFASAPRVPLYTPPRPGGAVHAPREGVHYGGNSFNPRTRLLYVAGKELPIYMTVEPVGKDGVPGKMELAGVRVSAAPETGHLVALDPASGEVRWRTPLVGGPSTGTLTTAGGLVLVADRQGTLYAVEAEGGRLLWQFATGGAIRAGQITYSVNGVQYVTVPSGGDVILTFALPARRR
jgi:alcohol dehydrogenase (cytochrome c)